LHQAKKASEIYLAASEQTAGESLTGLVSTLSATTIMFYFKIYWNPRPAFNNVACAKKTANATGLLQHCCCQKVNVAVKKFVFSGSIRIHRHQKLCLRLCLQNACGHASRPRTCPHISGAHRSPVSGGR